MCDIGGTQSHIAIRKIRRIGTQESIINAEMQLIFPPTITPCDLPRPLIHGSHAFSAPLLHSAFNTTGGSKNLFSPSFLLLRVLLSTFCTPLGPNLLATSSPPSQIAFPPTYILCLNVSNTDLRLRYMYKRFSPPTHHLFNNLSC